MSEKELVGITEAVQALQAGATISFQSATEPWKFIPVHFSKGKILSESDGGALRMTAYLTGKVWRCEWPKRWCPDCGTLLTHGNWEWACDACHKAVQTNLALTSPPKRWCPDCNIECVYCERDGKAPWRCPECTCHWTNTNVLIAAREAWCPACGEKLRAPTRRGSTLSPWFCTKCDTAIAERRILDSPPNRYCPECGAKLRPSNARVNWSFYCPQDNKWIETQKTLTSPPPTCAKCGKVLLGVPANLREPEYCPEHEPKPAPDFEDWRECEIQFGGGVAHIRMRRAK